jgi:hypothetical protein
MSEPVPIDINNINEGAMVEGFEIELRRALENIADINTVATATREVALVLLLKPHADRVQIETEFRCKSKLAGVEVHKSKLFLGHTEEGTPIAFLNDPRQMPLWSAPAPPLKKNVVSFGADGVQK